MMEPAALLRPAEYAESRVIDAILNGAFPIGSALPAERELAARLGITRPTLREAMQRLARDGWLEIRQGKPTRVRDYWREGSLGVLNALAHRPWAAPAGFVPNLLGARLALAPAYARQAVERRPAEVAHLLYPAAGLPAETPVAGDEPQIEALAEAYATFDWRLHHGLTLLSDNPIFTLIINGFCDLYAAMARRYFRSPAARHASRAFYTELSAAAAHQDAEAAERITRAVMLASLDYWQQANSST